METSSVLGEKIINSITTGCQNVVSGATEGITAVLPLGLSVMALTVGIRLAVGFFRSLAH